MKSYRKELWFEVPSRRAFLNITPQVEAALRESGIAEGLVLVKTMKITDRWSTAPGGAPVGMSMDREHRRLFIGCRKPQRLIIMSADDGKILGDLPIGAGVDTTQFDGDVFASCRDASLAVAREASAGKFEIVQTVKTEIGARTMGLDPKTHTLYLPTAEFSPPTKENPRPAAKPNSFLILVVKPSRPM
jgi:hypothetical protein